MKKRLIILPLALILCFMVGCQDKAAMTELEAFKAQAALEEQNINLIRDMTKEWDEEGISNLGKYYSSDCVIHYPGGMDVNGLDAIIERNIEFKAAFSNMDHNIEDVIAQGEIVAVRFFGKMTHTGGFQRIPPTGKEISFTAMEFCRISEGKIVEVWQDADVLGLLIQLGMELKPKDGEK